jgi:hypothetical protein
MTATELTAALAVIEAAILSGAGAATISLDGQAVTYQGLEALLKVRDRYRAELARLNGRRPRCASVLFPGA